MSPTGPAAVQDLTIDAVALGERVLVTVRGELDISTDQALEAALLKAVGSSTRGVDLDLSCAAFCDCSGLNVLLAARRHALDSGKTLSIRSASPAVRWLLSATGTRPLFEPDHQAPSAWERALNREAQELRDEVDQLRRAMATRPVIDQAKGILMASFKLSPEDAWTVLVRVSQNTNTKLHRLAGELVTAVQGGALCEASQQQLAAALVALDAAPELDPSLD
ncbi:ANTAR domain-containing protein [Streptomyces sp. NPDC048420]|uniref:ANTAR domain-containing protein n=1 Tax=Streptomyces sp. NPDC048420 TaxID=3155755 RepID=UPI003449761B